MHFIAICQFFGTRRAKKKHLIDIKKIAYSPLMKGLVKNKGIIMRLKLTIVSMILFLMQSFAGVDAQITIAVRDAKLDHVFSSVSRQSGFDILYNPSLIRKSGKVTVQIKNSNLRDALSAILKDKNLKYEIIGKTVIIKELLVQSKKPEIKPLPVQPIIVEQWLPVTGTITDAAGVPLEGASVMIKGKKIGATSSSDGTFKLEAKAGDVLVISMVGYEDKEVPVVEGDLNIVLNKKDDKLDDVVIVGYGTQKKVNLTGAVSTVNYSKEASSRPLVDATQALAGLAPGLQVMQGSGNPYGESYSMNIRGIGTLNNSNPLVLVDGMEQSLGNVNPIDIETISVLKDAASSAIYGNRGANGVILITTKTGGKKDRINIDISSMISRNSPMRTPKLVNNYADYMELTNESYTNLGRPAAFTQATIDLWREKEKDPNGIAESGYPNYVAYPNTDWYDAVYDNSLMQEHSVQVSGSTAKSGYNFSFGYLDNPGILKKSGFERYFVRTNIYTDIAKWLRVGSRIWGYNTDRDRIGTGSLTSLDMTKIVPGTYPYYDGKYGAPESNEEDPQSHNALWDMNYEHGDMKYTQIFTNFYASLKFLKHFTYDFGYWYKHSIYDGKFASNAYPKWSFGLNEITAAAADLKTATTGQTYNRENYRKLNHVLNYRQSFENHDITAMAGFEEERNWSRTSNVTLQGLIDTKIDDLDVGTSFKSASGASAEFNSRSWFGRVTYAFDQKYLFEANFRADGSSRFAPENRWGYFPAASVGWRISQESFMANTKGWLTDLKLRASWGKLGNNSIGNYEWQQTYGLVNYPFNSTTTLGLAPTAQANIALRWEESTTKNIGLDFGFLNNRLSGTVDVYTRLTSGILYRPTIMLIYGNITAARQNIAEVTNNGIELQLAWKDRINDFSYSISGNVAFNRNEVSKYKGALVRGWETNAAGERVYSTNLGDVSTGGTNRVLEGHMIDEYYMLQTYKGDQSYFNADGTVNPNGGPGSGMIRTEQDMAWLTEMVAAGYKFYPNQTIGKAGIWYGDYIYADLNGDGIYGNTHDNDFVGSSSMPKLNFGLQMAASWKGFDLSMNWYGVTGNRIYFYRNGQNASTTIKGYAIGQEVADDHYFYDPENSSDPRTNLTSVNPRLTNNSGSSQSESTNTQWLYKGDFLKLKNVTLGYSIPKQLIQKISVQNVRVFLSGENLLTITNYPGIDPEMRTSIGYLTYRQLAVGVNVTF